MPYSFARVVRLGALLVAAALALPAIAHAADSENAFPELTLSPTLTTAAEQAASQPLMLDAAPAAADPNPWQFTLGIPIWLPSIGGDINIRGHSISPGNDIGRGWNDFTRELDGAFTLRFEANKGPWGFWIDTMYLGLSTDTFARPDGRVLEFTEKAFIGELCGFYRFYDSKPGQRGWGAIRADVYGGMRVAWVELGLKGQNIDTSVDHTIWDPIVGARVEAGLLSWLSWKLRGDVGGFGISEGTTSDHVWNVDTALEFHLAKWFDIDLGYRWLDYDFSRGDSSFDADINGPYINLQFRF